MMNTIRTAAITLLLAVTASQASAQAPVYQDIVRDQRGNAVVDQRGNCVRTKWEASGDACGPNAPAPVAQPVPYQQSQNYLVFFDFDRANITPESRNVLETVANEYGKTHQFVLATGHADRSGTDAYNVRLSQRRAEAVKKSLVGMGIPASNISTQAKGERDPLVPTGDGVREPQNRRVEIQFETRR